MFPPTVILLQHAFNSDSTQQVLIHLFINSIDIYYEQGIVPRTVGYAKKCNNGYFGTVTDKEKNQYFSELNCL